MGAACCVAAKDRTISNRSSSETVQRNVRYSPSWSFRWDNRGRVAGEETSMNWLSDGVNRNDGLDVKSCATAGSAYVSEEGSPLESFRTVTWQKSPIPEEYGGLLWIPPSDPPISRTSTEVKESTASPAIPYLSPTKMSPSMRSVSSLSTSPLSYQSQLLPASLTPSKSTSPLSYQSQLLPASLTPSRCARRSPGHQLLRQVSDSRIRGLKSPSFSISEEGSFGLPGWTNETIGGCRGGSSDNWSIPGFPELMAARRERWSFDTETLGMTRDRVTQFNGQSFSSTSADVKSCGVCSKLVTERSSWARQSIIGTNEIAVVAVLICGHAYHAECLENMTPPEISKYDPSCPVCTLGEKQTLKLSGKALRAEIDLIHLKAKISKRLKNCVIDSDVSSDSTLFNSQKNSGPGRNSKTSACSSMKSSSGTHFLRKHLSFGLKGTKSFSDNNSSRKRGFFWAKSNK